MVWALEKLCFRKETFEIGAYILLKFSVNENENIANNATNQFYSLFPVKLGATQASLLTRLEFIEHYARENGNMPFILGAINRGLKCTHFIRMGTPEEQGGKRLEEYNPNTEEIKKYWNGLVDILKREYTANDQLSSEARRIIISQLSIHTHRGDAKLLLDAIQFILEQENEMSPDILLALVSAKKTDPHPVPEKIVTSIEILIDKYAAKDIRGLLITKIVNPPNEPYRKNGQYYNKAEDNALLFVDELIAKNDYTWMDHIDLLVSDRQQMTQKFGELLGSANKGNPERFEDIVNKTLDELSKIPFEKQNIAFVYGLLEGINSEDVVRVYIYKIATNPNISRNAIEYHGF